MTAEQQAWLRSTAVPLRSITFCPEERESQIITKPVSTVLFAAP